MCCKLGARVKYFSQISAMLRNKIMIRVKLREQVGQLMANLLNFNFKVKVDGRFWVKLPIMNGSC